MSIPNFRILQKVLLVPLLLQYCAPPPCYCSIYRNLKSTMAGAFSSVTSKSNVEKSVKYFKKLHVKHINQI